MKRIPKATKLKYSKHLPRTVRLYTCSVCGNVGGWSDSWEWYGSWRDVDGGRPVIVTCSDKCRDIMETEAAIAAAKPGE